MFVESRILRIVNSAAAVKRGFSAEARRRQLDTSSKPRRVLWAFCAHHQGSYYFYDVRLQPLKPKERLRWQNEPDMRKVRALCMHCNKTSVLFVGQDELREHRYASTQLCYCLLPLFHKDPPPEFLAQYNANPVSCRQSPNGHFT